MAREVFAHLTDNSERTKLMAQAVNSVGNESNILAVKDMLGKYGTPELYTVTEILMLDLNIRSSRAEIMNALGDYMSGAIIKEIM